MSLFTFRTVIMAVFILAAASLAQSQTQMRSWVSAASGNDNNNPCARTAPCKTFSVALAKTAAGGEINCVDSGDYGVVSITKPVSIDCTGTFAGITTTSNTDAISINVQTSVVRLRGLSLHGGGSMGYSGIKILSAGQVVVDNVVIEGFTVSGIAVMSSVSGQVFISNSSIRNNGKDGLRVTPSKGISSVTVLNSQILSNFEMGINAQKSNVAVTNCLIAGNATGIQASNSGTVRISGNTISANGTGLIVGSSGKIISYMNNALTGNTTDGAPSSTVALQ